MNILSQIDLPPAEIAKLPPGIRKKMESAFGPVDQINGAWRLIGVRSEGIAKLIDSALLRLPVLANIRKAASREQKIDKILELIIDDVPHADIYAKLELKNAKMRAEYLSATPILTAQQVRDISGLTPRNKSEPASRWKRDKKVFAVTRGGINLYPAFQFEDGAPKPIIRRVLDILPNDMSDWQIAFWFDSGNGWLDGIEPKNCLSQAEEILYAAQQVAEPAIG
ncbi:MAG: hypothetical protein F4X29_12815 [Rhodothermaceae bacterium]|nr:hypothetical protein [Rhodothermaceae bacterium]